MQYEEYDFLIDIPGEWFKKMGDLHRAAMKIHHSIDGYNGIYAKVSSNNSNGVRYYLQLSEDMAVLYANVNYSDSYSITYHAINPDNDFFSINYVIEDYFEGSSNKEEIKETLKARLKTCIILSDFPFYTHNHGKECQKVHVLRLVIKRKYAIQLARQVFSHDNIQKMFSPEFNTIYRKMDMDFSSREIIDKLSKMDPGDISFGFHLSAAAHSLLANFVTAVKNERPIILPLLKSDIEMVYDAQQYLIDHLEEEFPGIDKLSAIANMSGTKFKQLFTKVFGTSPNSFFISKKMDYAKEMLLSGRYKVTEVAYELAYSNLGFFTKQFKKKFGQLPKEIIPAS